MKYGYFVGYSRGREKLICSSTKSSMEEFMELHRISDPKDVVGPYTLRVEASWLASELEKNKAQENSLGINLMDIVYGLELGGLL